MALWLSLLVAVAAMAICAAGGTIMRATGQAADLSAQAESFLRILMWGMFPMIAASVLRIFVSTLGRPKIATAITFLALFVNALGNRSEEHTSELQSLMRISYAVFCLKKKYTQS